MQRLDWIWYKALKLQLTLFAVAGIAFGFMFIFPHLTHSLIEPSLWMSMLGIIVILSHLNLARVVWGIPIPCPFSKKTC